MVTSFCWFVSAVTSLNLTVLSITLGIQKRKNSSSPCPPPLLKEKKPSKILAQFDNIKKKDTFVFWKPINSEKWYKSIVSAMINYFTITAKTIIRYSWVLIYILTIKTLVEALLVHVPLSCKVSFMIRFWNLFVGLFINN